MPEVNFFISFSFCLKVSLYAFWFWYNTWGGKGLFHLASLREARAGAQGRSLGAGTVAETMERCCFLARLHIQAQLPFLFNPGLPARVALPGVGPPPSVRS